jgi:chromosome partitioning protein
MIDGRTVCEVDPEGRSAIEIRELWQYVAGQLARQERRKVFHQPAALGFGRRAAL